MFCINLADRNSFEKQWPFNLFLHPPALAVHQILHQNNFHCVEFSSKITIKHSKIYFIWKVSYILVYFNKVIEHKCISTTRNVRLVFWPHTDYFLFVNKFLLPQCSLFTVLGQICQPAPRQYSLELLTKVRGDFTINFTITIEPFPFVWLASRKIKRRKKRRWKTTDMFTIFCC